MFSRFRKATPAPATNGNKKQFNQTQLNTATANLQTALNKIANQHVLKYANAIRLNAKAQANAARATAVATQTPTPTNISTAVKANEQAGLAHQNMIETEQAAETVVNTLPTSESVTPAVQTAEATAVNAVARNAAALANFNTRIAAANKTNTLTNIEVNIQKYANSHNIPYNRNNVKQRINAVNTKRNTIRAAPQN